MKTQCPYCGWEYSDLPNEYINQKLTCANCQKVFVASDNSDVPESPGNATVQAPKLQLKHTTAPTQQAMRLSPNTASNVSSLRAVGIILAVISVMAILGGLANQQAAAIGAGVDGIIGAVIIFALDGMAQNIARSTQLLEKIAKKLDGGNK